ncbi:hypothetical protein TWF694_001860 [Orbilia ellipsospora]|uniref:Uncharacterized protein n=1 Tax=Orbilia ellipsospora TaxID=2528407 RepID=A0AAV9X4X9_9PEZI
MFFSSLISTTAIIGLLHSTAYAVVLPSQSPATPLLKREWPDAAEVVLEGIKGTLDAKIYDDWKIQVWTMTANLGYRLEFIGHQLIDGNAVVPYPHRDEVTHMVDFDYIYKIWTCIQNKEHSDLAFCIDETACCLGVDKACARLNINFCDYICSYNKDTAVLTMADHTHTGVLPPIITGGPQRTC